MNIKIDDNTYRDFFRFWDRKQDRVFRYVDVQISNVGFFEKESVVISVQDKMLKAIQTGKYPNYGWNKLLSRIEHDTVVDFFRSGRRKVETIPIEDEYLEKIGVSEKPLSELVSEIKRDFDYALTLKRSILLSPHRTLQEAMLVFTVSTIKKLREKIEIRFPFVVNRVARRGLNFEVRKKGEGTFAEQQEDEIGKFYDLLFKLADALHLIDEIGIKALKALLLLEEPLFELYSISINENVYTKTYKSFDKKGKLIDKKPIRRPYINLFRDFIALTTPPRKKTLEPYERFLKYETVEKYPEKELWVDEDYVKNRYRIGTLNTAAIKKQKYGRKNSEGLLKKVRRYDAILQKFVDDM